MPSPKTSFARPTIAGEMSRFLSRSAFKERNLDDNPRKVDMVGGRGEVIVKSLCCQIFGKAYL